MVDNYKTYIPAVSADIVASSLTRLIFGGFLLKTEDVKIVKNQNATYCLQYVIFSSNLPTIEGQSLEGVFSNRADLVKRVSALTNCSEPSSEIRVIKKQCDAKDVYVLFVKPRA